MKGGASSSPFTPSGKGALYPRGKPRGVIARLLKNKELIQELVGKEQEFPKYVTQLINLANQNAQGTRPRVVGQLTDLIQECPEKTYAGWKEWCFKRHPAAIKDATEKIIARD